MLSNLQFPAVVSANFFWIRFQQVKNLLVVNFQVLQCYFEIFKQKVAVLGDKLFMELSFLCLLVSMAVSSLFFFFLLNLPSLSKI